MISLLFFGKVADAFYSRCTVVIVEITMVSVYVYSYKDFNELNYKEIQVIHSKLNLLNSAKINSRIKACLLSLTKNIKYEQS